MTDQDFKEAYEAIETLKKFIRTMELLKKGGERENDRNEAVTEEDR